MVIAVRPSPRLRARAAWTRGRDAFASDWRFRWAVILGLLGVVLHNWWVVIYPLDWMPSWHALISEAEAQAKDEGRVRVRP